MTVARSHLEAADDSLEAGLELGSRLTADRRRDEALKGNDK